LTEKNGEIMKCTMCPHECNIDRNKTVGRCKAKQNPTVALVSLHQFEEPCISTGKGSGTVFFSGCNLSCVYCQNSDISQELKGKEITIERLADIFIEQQERGAANINLVTPSIYVMQIKEALRLAKKNGLRIPIIYNSSGYDKIESLKELDGLIDIYLPDFKYGFNELGEKYSNVKNYFEVAGKAIKEMVRQVGYPIFDQNGKIIKGVIIRHMILPNNTHNTKKVLDWIKKELGQDAYISIMAQYFPTHKVNGNNFEEINRKISKEELEEIEEYIFELGFENGFIQELGEHEEEYVPEFTGDNV